jgi:crotonobetaine/carnitine-CoA ligase
MYSGFTEWSVWGRMPAAIAREFKTYHRIMFMDQPLDPRMVPADRCVLRDILERQARERPDQVFAVFLDGTEWTYRQTRDLAVRCANALRQLGVEQGQRVLSWLPNGPDALRLWFGLNYLGAVYVPINLSYRGGILEHVIRNAGARLIVAHADVYARLRAVALGDLRHAVVIGAAPAMPGLTAHPESALDSENTTPPALARAIRPWDTQSIIYTSGTTGPSKGVLSSYYHLYCMATESPDLRASDRFLVTLPMFHVGGTLPTYAMLALGGSLVMAPRFETQSFWQTVRQTRATTAILLGAMIGFLMRQPPRPDDREQPLRSVLIVPFNELAPAFKARFGCDIFTYFNMTEVSVPLRTEPNPTLIGGCGRPRPGVSVRLVDDNDCEVPVGGVGELVVRTDCPWALNHGYHNDPAATARAWRNGWFHTGDAFRVDAQGEYFFVDRLKDAIRRRGENISSFEIEAEVMAHPRVRELAAVAVACEDGEDEVLIAVAEVEGAALDPAELIRFLLPRMPHFMVPRYVRLVPELPKTPTQKVQKHLLRELGLNGAVWDRERAGIVVKRDKVG